MHVRNLDINLIGYSATYDTIIVSAAPLQHET